jgi:hypothetical protein
VAVHDVLRSQDWSLLEHYTDQTRSLETSGNHPIPSSTLAAVGLGVYSGILRMRLTLACFVLGVGRSHSQSFSNSPIRFAALDVNDQNRSSAALLVTIPNCLELWYSSDSFTKCIELDTGNVPRYFGRKRGLTRQQRVADHL